MVGFVRDKLHALDNSVFGAVHHDSEVTGCRLCTYHTHTFITSSDFVLSWLCLDRPVYLPHFAGNFPAFHLEYAKYAFEVYFPHLEPRNLRISTPSVFFFLLR